jgi:hypothetical protein
MIMALSPLLAEMTIGGGGWSLDTMLDLALSTKGLVTALSVLVVSFVFVFSNPIIRGWIRGGHGIPLPAKILPKRPILTIQFQPDDPVTTNLRKQKLKSTTKTMTTTSTTKTSTTTARNSSSARSAAARKNASTGTTTHSISSSLGDDLLYDPAEEEEEEKNPPPAPDPAVLAVEDSTDHDDDNDDPVFAIPVSRDDLPDSFAPLLSSSRVIFDTTSITPDLLDRINASASIKLRNGVHEIPLNIDKNRPQLRLHVGPEQDCFKIVADCAIDSGGGSDDNHHINKANDGGGHNSTSTSVITHHQSTVQSASLTFDPPLPLSNVAPTLIHFPTLFEDVYWSKLSMMGQHFSWWVRTAGYVLTILEEFLWLVESHCQIHLGKIRIVRNALRLQLSFSGHVLLFGCLPIPFLGVSLPTFIIPQPYALLNKLLTK